MRFVLQCFLRIMLICVDFFLDCFKVIISNFYSFKTLKYEYPSLDSNQSTVDAKNGWEVGKWWKRKRVADYMPAVEPDNVSVKQFLISNRLIVANQ